MEFCLLDKKRAITKSLVSELR